MFYKLYSFYMFYIYCNYPELLNDFDKRFGIDFFDNLGDNCLLLYGFYIRFVKMLDSIKFINKITEKYSLY